MESSRRAVEAYRRTRLIDGVTADDDKVAPVYKLDEVSDVLRTSSYDIVRELVEYIFRRLDHKSPIVKQKTLRVLKFTVGKSGNEFKREIQRQSGVIKQLFHYRGQPDPLRGDSLNVAVRDTAREAISAIFSSDEKSPIMEETSKRIQGFGSNNFDGRSQQPEKKTILSEVVGLGTASIKQGINLITQLNQYSNSHYTQNNGMGSNSTGNYEAPKFRKSLSDRDSYRDSSTYLTRRDDVYRSHRGWNDEEDSHSLAAEVHTSAEQDGSRGEDNEGGVMSEEEKLLENVTPPGGVRLQPSRDSVTSFLLEAQKLNPENLHYAFHKRLQAHSWQIRFKALCFLEAVMRQRDIAQFKEVCEVFERDSGSISECVESPQVSLREKAKKVLSMLESPHSSSAEEMKAEKSFVQLPDLMDTGDSEGLNLGIEELSVNHSLLGSITTDEEDPFSGLAIHPTTAVTATPATATATATVTVTATPAVTTTVTTTSTIVDPFFMVNENENGNGNGNDGLFEGLSVSSKKEEASLVDLLDAGGTDDHHHQQQQQPLISSSSSRSNQLNSSFNNFTAHQQTFQSLLQHPQQQQQQQQLQQQQQQQLKTAFDSFKGYEQQTFQRVPQQQMHMHQMQMQMGGMYGDGFDFSATRYPSSSSTSSSMMMMMSHDKKEDTKAFDFIADHVSAARTKK